MPDGRAKHDMAENNQPHVAVKEATKARLDALKVHPREPYDDVITRILDALQEKTAPKPAAVPA